MMKANVPPPLKTFKIVMQFPRVLQSLTVVLCCKINENLIPQHSKAKPQIPIRKKLLQFCTLDILQGLTERESRPIILEMGDDGKILLHLSSQSQRRRSFPLRRVDDLSFFIVWVGVR